MTRHLSRLPVTIGKTPILLAVICFNFLFVGVDVLMAHSENNVFRWALIPVVYSPLAVLAIAALLVFRHSVVLRRVFTAVMWGGVAVGVFGTFFHLTGNATGGPETLHRLVIEGSPVAAPIAFAGIAIYALASERYRGPERRSKLLVLTGLGFGAAVVAAFLDHGRLSFVPGYTLIPLVSGTLAALSCLYLASHRTGPAETRLHLYVMALSVLVGLAGFGFHIAGDLAGTESIVWARLLYRNPVLGPLLFCDLALLGALSILPEGRSGELGDAGGSDPAEAHLLVDPGDVVALGAAEDSGHAVLEGVAGEQVGDSRGQSATAVRR